MGLFKNHSRRESGDFKWPFRPTDGSAEAQRRVQAKQHRVKISQPVLLESTKDVSSLPAVPRSAPIQQKVWEPVVTVSAITEKFTFEPLFEDCYVSPIEEQFPMELSAAHAARFHDYLKDLSSVEPSVHSSEYSEEEEEDNTEEEEDDVEIHEAQQATTVCLNSPGKPKMINLSLLSSASGSTHSASSSSSDVRLSGFLHSRSPSEAIQLETPYTPLSFLDSSAEPSPSDEPDDDSFSQSYDGDALDLCKTVTVDSSKPTTAQLDRQETHAP